MRSVVVELLRNVRLTTSLIRSCWSESICVVDVSVLVEFLQFANSLRLLERAANAKRQDPEEGRDHGKQN